MTYYLTDADAVLLREALQGIPDWTAGAEGDLRAARLIAPDLLALDPQWRPGARARERAAAAARAASAATRPGAAAYELVEFSEAGTISRILEEAAHSEQAWAWEAAGTGDPDDTPGRLDKATHLRRLAWLIRRFYDEDPTEGQVLVYLGREYDIAREESPGGSPRRLRLAATMRALLEEAEPTSGTPLPYKTMDGALHYP
ncbi:hypothetical protein [Brachybacterium kimchii]|uniref:Uncharacterized protein n=1 Tax=Brachybacterium kimchii TaxID=2942909 RepID=A0ABY4NB56_9MICO|nr:hypothetical protein [Brachybacterium kimchii]UQN31776.1 hypothetical protein M4486_19495 [Brachybacterium kimchii]